MKQKAMKIDPRLAIQSSEAVVISAIDALVELITNCDDSYRLMKTKEVGRIWVEVNRSKEGFADVLLVSDRAQGMTSERLERILTFGAELSGATKGEEVRGFFGRGLKESIISLGEAELVSVRDEVLASTRARFDDQKALTYDPIVKQPIEALTATQTTRYSAFFGGVLPKSGTAVRIMVTRKRLKLQEYDLLARNLSQHLSLRDITTSPLRELRLRLRNEGARPSERVKDGPLSFAMPPGKLVFRERLKLAGFSEDYDFCDLLIQESATELHFHAQDPTSIAGIRITTIAASLENQLFRWADFVAGRYFFGVAHCPGIQRRYTAGDTNLIKMDRSGLDYRTEYCKSIRQAIESALRPHVERKIEELQTPSDLQPKVQKNFSRLCAFLNQLFHAELDSTERMGVDVGDDIIDSLIIKPPRARGYPGEPRNFTVYLPKKLYKDSSSEVELELDGGRDIRLVQTKIPLTRHKLRKDLYQGVFQVIGKTQDERATIFAFYQKYDDQAEIIIGDPEESRRRSTLVGHKGGAFRNISFNDAEMNPSQRVSYVAGEVTVYLRFDPIGRYIHRDGGGLEQPAGNIMLSELVAEAFCRATAQRKLERGDLPLASAAKDPAQAVSAYNLEVNLLMKKYLNQIHHFVRSNFMGAHR